MGKREKLVRISEEIALREAGKFISAIHRGDKTVYTDTGKTEAKETFEIAGTGIRRV